MKFHNLRRNEIAVSNMTWLAEHKHMPGNHVIIQ